MPLAISCLGFAVHTSHSCKSWNGYKELRQAQKYSELYAESLREYLARKTFYSALERRDRISEALRKSKNLRKRVYH